MQAVDHAEGGVEPVGVRARRAARATQLARLWALSDAGDDEHDELRSRLLGLEVDEPDGEATR